MAKINIKFNNTEYSIDESSYASATAELKSHLSTVMNGTGAVINLDGTAYNVDSAKLSSAKDDFVAHLGTIAGNGEKITVGGVEYSVDSAKMASIVNDMHTVLNNLQSGSNVSGTLAAGIYETGAIALYEAGDSEAASAMMKKSWNDLVSDGTVVITDGALALGAELPEGDLVLPNDGSVTRISECTSYNFNSLTNITIPDSVTSIGKGMFGYDASINAVYISDIAAWCNISFADTDANPLCYARNLYLNGELVTDLVIPDGVTSIGSYAFYGCDSLTSITIPDSVTSIGDRAFANCTGLTSITIPNGVTSIGDYAFRGCNSLTNITIPNGVTSIGKYTFYGCTSLTSITIPNSVTSIGDYAFYNCTGLASVTIGDGVTSIGNSAFRYCTNLTTVYYTGNEEEWASIMIGTYNTPLTNATIVYNYVPPVTPDVPDVPEELPEAPSDWHIYIDEYYYADGDNNEYYIKGATTSKANGNAISGDKVYATIDTNCLSLYWGWIAVDGFEVSGMNTKIYSADGKLLETHKGWADDIEEGDPAGDLGYGAGTVVKNIYDDFDIYLDAYSGQTVTVVYEFTLVGTDAVVRGISIEVNVP